MGFEMRNIWWRIADVVIATVMGAAILAAGSFVFVSVREAVAVALLDTALTATHSDASPLAGVSHVDAVQAMFDSKLMTEAQVLDNKIDSGFLEIELQTDWSDYCRDARAGDGAHALSDSKAAMGLLTRYQQINGVGYSWPACPP
jgi:hypothetical protein